MVLKPEPLSGALRRCGGPEAMSCCWIRPAGPSPRQVARELAGHAHLVLLCGRYEGVDERVREHLVDEELSIGDYVLTGGELPALVVTDAVTRLLPGVLGDAAAPEQDSFARGLLDHPQYTRPESSAAGRCRRCCSRATTGGSPAGGGSWRCGGPGSAGRTCWRRRISRRRSRSGRTGSARGECPKTFLSNLSEQGA